MPDGLGSDLTPGEVRRSLARIEGAVGELRQEVRDRHHKLSSDLQNGLGPVAVAISRLDRAEHDIQGLGDQLRLQIGELERQVQLVAVKAAWIAGVISGGGFVLTLILRKLGV